MTRSATERTSARTIPGPSPVSQSHDVALRGQQLALIDVADGGGAGLNGLDLPEQIASWWKHCTRQSLEGSEEAEKDLRLLFTDVGLPGGLNGRQLADEARRRRPDLLVLFTTGYTRNAIIHRPRR